LPNFAKSCPGAARSDRAPRNLRRSSSEGSVGSLRWVSERGCQEFQQALVQAASRSCRPASIARDPQFPPFPTQNGPTGFPRRPHCTAVVISRRKTPARTSRGTNQRVHAAREGLAARFQLPIPFPRCTTHDSRTSLSNSQPASRFTGPMPLRRTFPVLSKQFAPVHGAYPGRRELGVSRFRAHRARVQGPSRERLSPAAQANSQVFSFSESCFCSVKTYPNVSVHGLHLTQKSMV
jgi:hypothetical protein